MKQVSKSLRAWFKIHFVVDFIIAIPLIFFTKWTLGLFGFPLENLIFARLVGAALIGIGGTSFLIRNKTKSQYDSLLTLKIVWSLSAMVALVLSISQGAPKTLWIFVAVFAIFFFIWLHYKIRN